MNLLGYYTRTEEISFLEDLCLQEYYRKNYDSNNWRSILSKIANIEQKIIELYIFDEDSDNNSGIRAYPNGEIKSFICKWVEVN